MLTTTITDTITALVAATENDATDAAMNALDAYLEGLMDTQTDDVVDAAYDLLNTLTGEELTID